MGTDIDFVAVLEEASARAVAALAADRSAPIPWSDDWTVEACAHHVGTVQHWIERVVAGRPTADWTAREGIDAPEVGSAALAGWVADGSRDLLATLRSATADEACWSWWPDDQTVGFWQRRAAHETLVHRWDCELGAGVEIAPMEPALAADGIDECLDVFVGMSRFLHASPGAGETFHVHCTDTDGEWLLACTAPGERELRREHAKGDVAFRGRAEDLLLVLWGRRSAEDGGVEVLGDPAVRARWAELVPSM